VQRQAAQTGEEMQFFQETSDADGKLILAAVVPMTRQFARNPNLRHLIDPRRLFCNRQSQIEIEVSPLCLLSG